MIRDLHWVQQLHRLLSHPERLADPNGDGEVGGGGGGLK